MSEPSAIQSSASPQRLVRWSLALVGLAFVGLGAVGLAVPGLPTTVFLLGASWCFAKSCPYLEQKLLRNRVFAPFMRYVDRAEPIAARTKAWAIGVMWLFVMIALAVFALEGGAFAWLSAPVAGAAGIGTFAIVRWDAGVSRSECADSSVAR